MKPLIPSKVALFTVIFPNGEKRTLLASNSEEALKYALLEYPSYGTLRPINGFGFRIKEDILAIITYKNPIASYSLDWVFYITRENEFYENCIFKELFRFKLNKKFHDPKRRLILWLIHYIYCFYKQDNSRSILSYLKGKYKDIVLREKFTIKF